MKHVLGLELARRHALPVIAGEHLSRTLSGCARSEAGTPRTGETGRHRMATDLSDVATGLFVLLVILCLVVLARWWQDNDC